MATVVAIITSMVVANATQTITTPNAAFVSYNLAAGANSAAITPASNRSVLVMGCTTSGSQGVGHVSLFHSSGFIEWVGLESYNGSTPAITAGDSNTAIHIVYIEFFHHVDIQVATTDTIRIHNGDTVTQAGNVTLI